MKRPGSPKDREALAAEIARLPKLATDELRERWKMEQTFPPKAARGCHPRRRKPRSMIQTNQATSQRPASAR